MQSKCLRIWSQTSVMGGIGMNGAIYQNRCLGHWKKWWIKVSTPFLFDSMWLLMGIAGLSLFLFFALLNLVLWAHWDHPIFVTVRRLIHIVPQFLYFNWVNDGFAILLVKFALHDRKSFWFCAIDEHRILWNFRFQFTLKFQHKTSES